MSENENADNYNGSVQSQDKEHSYITEEEAITLALQLRDFITTRLQIPIGNFFSTIDRDSFSGKPIPILNSDLPEEITEDKVHHYYVTWSPATQFPRIAPHNDYNYYKDIDRAKLAHQENLARGDDSLFEALAADSREKDNQLIHRQLFNPNLYYGLMTIAHEPLHPWLKSPEGKYIDGYDFEEAVVTYLGYEIVTLFLKDKPETAWMANQHEEVLQNLMNKYSFLRKAYISLGKLYMEGNKGFSKFEILKRRRNEQEQQLMEELRIGFGSLYSDPDYKQEMMADFNNAFLARTIAYTGITVINDYFETRQVEVYSFLTDSQYSGRHMKDLQAYFQENQRNLIMQVNDM